MARFRRQAHLLAALNHPHIAAIYGLEESDEALALAMELVAFTRCGSIRRINLGERQPSLVGQLDEVP